MSQSFDFRIGAAAGAICLFCSLGAAAIQRSDDGAGQYLIAPFVIASGHYETLIEISDSTEDSVARALKLRVLDRDGEPRLTANLYLAKGATWAGGLTRQEDMARVVASSDSCLLIEGPAGIEVADQVDFDFNAGSLEVVEMGIAVDPPLAEHVDERDCEAIVDLWNDGAWSPGAALSPPSGNLRVGARVINVSKGTLYGVPATGLKNFSNIVQHTEPGSAQPDLAATHDDGTSAGQTRSVVCSDGQCIEDFWDVPIDAASAALLTYTASDSYEVSDSLAAESEWVVTYPTMAYYAQGDHWGSSVVSLLVTDRRGDKLHGGYLHIPELPPAFTSTSIWLEHERPVNLINFKMADVHSDEPTSYGVFGLEAALRFRDLQFESLPDNGLARLGFESALPLFTQFIESSSGRLYWGRPAIVTSFTEFTNGTLPGGDGVLQRANYGSSGAVSTTARIDEPED